MFKVFYNQVRFEKKNWQLLFENAIKKKKRGGNLNYKTHPVVLFSSVSVTKKKKERSRTKTIFKASNDPVSKVKVWILTQIEGRIQENVRIFFLTSF